MTDQDKRRDFVLLNPDGTVNNIVHLVDPLVIATHEDWKDLQFIEYTDWADEDKPRTHWIYNFDDNTWTKPEPTQVGLPDEILVPLEEPAADELAGGTQNG